MPARKKTTKRKTAPKAAKKTANGRTGSKKVKKDTEWGSEFVNVEYPEKGLLITFEGSEGSGKSTQISCLAERFENLGHDVVVTREPGGTEVGEEIRHLLMHAAAGDALCPESELLLFAASRAQLVRECIIPSLEEGKVVLCDRFLDSTTVYQGVGRQIAAEPVHIINTFAVGNLVPDVTIVLDIPAEIGFKRIKHRASDMPDRMESETIDFYKKVREGYLFLAKAMNERFIVIDGTQEQSVIEEQIWDELKQRFT